MAHAARDDGAACRHVLVDFQRGEIRCVRGIRRDRDVHRCQEAGHVLVRHGPHERHGGVETPPNGFVLQSLALGAVANHQEMGIRMTFAESRKRFEQERQVMPRLQAAREADVERGA